jgi:hypothetical protein
MKIYRLEILLFPSAEGVAVLILLAATAIMIPLTMVGMFSGYLFETLRKKRMDLRQHPAGPGNCVPMTSEVRACWNKLKLQEHGRDVRPA